MPLGLDVSHGSSSSTTDDLSLSAADSNSGVDNNTSDTSGGHILINDSSDVIDNSSDVTGFDNNVLVKVKTEFVDDTIDMSSISNTSILGSPESVHRQQPQLQHHQNREKSEEKDKIPEKIQQQSPQTVSRKILVHCRAGFSRSPSTILAYLIKHAHMTLAGACELVARGMGGGIDVGLLIDGGFRCVCVESLACVYMCLCGCMCVCL